MFYGFLDKKEKELKKILNQLSSLDFSLIFFIPASKINFYISKFKEYFIDRDILIAKEMTKIHEKNIRGKMESFDSSAENFKGELTVGLSGKRMDKNIKKEISESVKIEIKKMKKKYSHKDVVEFISNKENYSPDALFQKGSYALRRLYHESKKPLFVIYTSKNCGPCHILKPQISRVIEELKGAVQCVEIDIESDQEIAKQSGISGTPTVHLFLNKSLIRSWSGVKQRSVFKDEIENLLRN